MPKWARNLPDEYVYKVCDLFLKGTAAKELVVEVSQPKDFEAAVETVLTREKIYPVVREALRRNLLTMNATTSPGLAAQLRDGFPVCRNKRITVLNSPPGRAFEDVAEAAADRVFEICKEKARQGEVRIGIGAGNTTSAFCRAFSRRLTESLATSVKVPESIVLHALTTGMSARKPQSAPVASFALFHDLSVRFVGLFGRPITKRYHEKEAGAERAFAEKDAIDVVVTAISSAEDDHGLLRAMLDEFSEGDVEEKGNASSLRSYLKGSGWIGDVLYQPYSDAAEINLADQPRPLALLDLAELSDWRLEGREIILMVPPCSECASLSLRDAALLPLLKKSRLDVWTHLITDGITARKCIADLET